MANYRQIHVTIWKDAWFLDLGPDEKLLFIYLFSNELASLSGIYKIPLKVIVFETGFDQKFIEAAFEKFAKDGKAVYQDGVVWVINMRRYNKGGDTVEKRVQADVDEIPECPIKSAYLQYHNLGIPYRYPIDTTSYINEMNLNEMNNTKGRGTLGEGFCSSEMALEVFTQVTGMIMFPSRSRDSDIEHIIKLYKIHKSNTARYLQPFYDEWSNRGYRRTNTNWFDWAVDGTIPERKDKKDLSLDQQLAADGYTGT